MSYLLGLLAGILIAPNILRWNRKTFVSLGKNCLLTWHPIVFVEGPKSIFYFGRYWNRIPDYLEKLGYNVSVLKMPWRNKEAAKKVIVSYLSELSKEKKQVHLFMDGTTLQSLGANFLRSHDAVATVNVPEVRTHSAQNYAAKWADYISYPSYLSHRFMLRLYGWKHDFSPSHLDALMSNNELPKDTLKQVIHIAEEDFIGSQKSEPAWN